MPLSTHVNRVASKVDIFVIPIESVSMADKLAAVARCFFPQWTARHDDYGLSDIRHPNSGPTFVAESQRVRAVGRGVNPRAEAAIQAEQPMSLNELRRKLKEAEARENAKMQQNSARKKLQMEEDEMHMGNGEFDEEESEEVKMTPAQKRALMEEKVRIAQEMKRAEDERMAHEAKRKEQMRMVTSGEFSNAIRKEIDKITSEKEKLENKRNMVNKAVFDEGKRMRELYEKEKKKAGNRKIKPSATIESMYKNIRRRKGLAALIQNQIDAMDMRIIQLESVEIQATTGAAMSGNSKKFNLDVMDRLMDQIDENIEFKDALETETSMFAEKIKDLAAPTPEESEALETELDEWLNESEIDEETVRGRKEQKRIEQLENEVEFQTVMRQAPPAPTNDLPSEEEEEELQVDDEYEERKETEQIGL